uniref:Uncharacterized protein n=1 Tax=Ditylenchus dipsaci TaxID=166011 RepID=A0A915CM05_9BILA
MSSGYLPNTASSSTADVTSNGCPQNLAASAASEIPRKRLVKSDASSSAVKVSYKHPPRPAAAVLPTKPPLSKPCWNSHYSPRQSSEPPLLKRKGEEMGNTRNALSSRAALLSSPATRETLAVLLDAFQLPPMLKSAVALPISSCAALDASGGASLLKWPPEESFKNKYKKQPSHLPNPIKGEV